MSFNNAIKVGNTIGKAKATISLITGFVIVLILVPVASWLLLRKRKYDTEIEAKITNLTNDKCESYQRTKKRKNSSTTTTHYKCDITYEYTVNNETYTNNVTLDKPRSYKVNDVVTVYYNPRNPKESRPNSDDLRLPGAILSGLSCIVFTMLVINYYLTSNIKGYGTTTLVMNMMRPRK